MKKFKRILPVFLAVCVLMSGTLITMNAMGIGMFSVQPVALLPQDTALIPLNAVWKYTTDDPGSNWNTTGFNDGSWASGEGPLGYGYDNTANEYKQKTAVPQPASGSRHTTYFRTEFDVSNKQDIQNLRFEGASDDGAIYYLNGTEIARLGVADNQTHTTNSSTNVNKLPGVDAGEAFLDKTIRGAELQNLLVTGKNVISVRVHQLTASSSDMYMQLKVTANIEVSGYDYKTLGVFPGTNSTERGFAWYSSSANAETSQLQYIKKSQLSDGKFPATGFTTVNAVTSTAGSTGFISNKATVSGLEENMEYAYRIGDGTNWSETFEFKTFSSSGDFNFLFIGDAQIGASGNSSTDSMIWRSTVKKAVEMFPNSAFMASAGDQVDSGSNESQYDGFYSPEELRKLPFAPTVGNHDNPHPNFVYHYNTPNPGTYQASNSGPNYYYVYNNTLLIHLNLGNFTTTVNTAEQDKFIKEAVAANPNARWRIIVMHYDIYGSGKQHSTQDYTATMRKSLYPIFEANGIDVALTGHDHVFTRSYQMLNNVPQKAQITDDNGAVINPSGIFYFTANSSSSSKYYDLAPVAQEWVAARSQLRTPTFSNVEITNNSFKIQTYRVDSGELLDTYTILKVASKEALEEAVNAGRAIVEIDYTPESYAEFKIAFEAAKAALNSEDGDEIMEAMNGLRDANNKLVRVSEKAFLKEKLDTAQALYDYSVEGDGANQHEPGSKAKLKASIDLAKVIYEKGEATQEEVNTQVTVLGDAIDLFMTSINSQIVEPEDPESSEPVTSEPGTSEPGTSQPGTSEPGTSQPGTSEPGTSQPQTSEPGTSQPGTSQPQTSTPQASTPQASTPQASTPGTPSSNTEASAPVESEQPVSSAPSVTTGNIAKDGDVSVMGDGVPKDALLKVVGVGDQKVIDTVKELLPKNDGGKRYDFITMYDISLLYSDGSIIENFNGQFLVSIPLEKFDGVEGKKYVVFHYNEAENKMERLHTYVEDGYLKFITTHFSKFAITEEVSVDASSNPKGDNPGTGDNIPAAAFGITAVTLLGGALLIAYRRNRQNAN